MNNDYHKLWRQNHPDYFKRWTKEHPEAKALHNKSWRSKNATYIQEYNSSAEGKYKNYKSIALQRSLPFDLTLEEFKSFWQRPCHYCGDPIETIGLDRKDNVRGYTLDNVIPCCRSCNYAKNVQSYDDYIARCHKVATLHP